MDAGDTILGNHSQKAGPNATYLSWNIQNRIVDACNEIILKQLVNRVNSAKSFVVLPDETIYVSTVEQ